MRKLIRSLASRVSRWYRSMSIQMVISLSFTAVAVVGILFIGLSLFWRFSTTTNRLQEDGSQRVLAQVTFNLDG